MKHFLLISSIIVAAYSWANVQPYKHTENSWEGIYKSEIGELTITNVTSTGFDFKILVETEECAGAIGKAKATATIKGNNKAVYKADECTVTFELIGENSITVTENNCNLYHGMMCTFNGTYKK